MNSDTAASPIPETPQRQASPYIPNLVQPACEEGSPRPDPDVGTIIPDVRDGTPQTIFGPYGLLRQFGKGGTGVVFHMRRFQPIRRDVALKVKLDSITPAKSQ